MRVWALASCSGLLALAACSAEQPQSTQVDLPSPLRRMPPRSMPWLVLCCRARWEHPRRDLEPCGQPPRP